MPFVPSSKANSIRYPASTLTSLIRLTVPSPLQPFHLLNNTPEYLLLCTAVFISFCLSNSYVVVKSITRNIRYGKDLP